MQAELEAERPELEIHLLAINEIGYDAGLPDISAVGDLPVLQDDSTQLVWDRWGANWRDVFVLDGANETAVIYNLTTYDLSIPENYAALKDWLIVTAEG